MSIVIRDGTNAAQLATVDVDGNLHVLDGSSGTPGSAVPTTANMIAGSDGTDLQTVATDASGQVKVLVENAVTLNAIRTAVFPISVQSTSATPSTLIASAAAHYTDIVTLILTNEGTATVVSISDGTITYKFALAANGIDVINFPTPLPASSSATAWTVSNSAAQTVDCVLTYLKN